MPAKEREKLEFSTNIPMQVTLGKNFKSGTGEWGAWHGWNMMHNGQEKVVFAKDALHDKIKGYGEGAKLTITYAEKKGDSGLYHEWEVVSANGSKPAPASQATKPNGHKADYRIQPDAQEFNLESHLLACAEIANKIAEKIGITDDAARQATFATVAIDAQRHNVILGDSKPSEAPRDEAEDGRKEALMKGVRSACKLLNEEGYEPQFSPKALSDYVAENFRKSIADLSPDETEDLLQRLSEQLDDFRLSKSVAENSIDPDDDTAPF